MEAFANNDRFEFLKQDVHLLDSLLGVGFIYHLASMTSPEDFIEVTADITLSNTQATRRLLDYARTCDARVAYPSTSYVYPGIKSPTQILLRQRQYPACPGLLRRVQALRRDTHCCAPPPIRPPCVDSPHLQRLRQANAP